MSDRPIADYDFTDDAWESLYNAVDDVHFLDQDAHIIYNSLRKKLRFISFGDYLKRYIYLKAELSSAYSDVSIRDYQIIIRDAFKENHTPPSFTPTTAKLSALSKNWLTQQTVKRPVVFLLGFGLNMSLDDVNLFLTKALREREINPKDPFEVICWYCFKNRYGYAKFEKLWSIYLSTPADSINMALLYSEYTIGARNVMQTIHDDATLIAHISKLKDSGNRSKISATSKASFTELYDKARDLVAKQYNAYEEECNRAALDGYISKLERNSFLADYEKWERIRQFKTRAKHFEREDITESDLEHIICAAIPTDRNGNLTPSKKSKLNEQFSGKRFSRQRISEILSGQADVSRFDLITLNFFIYSQSLDDFPDSKVRYSKFYSSTNDILKKCGLGELYIQNPYECFVLMCILSNDPLGTYADVWELSFSNNDDNATN